MTDNTSQQPLALSLSPAPPSLIEVGQEANRYVSDNVFVMYRRKRSAATVAGYDDDLANFRRFLTLTGAVIGDLEQDPAAWQGITFGLLEGYREWQVKQGAAIASINRRLSTVKRFSGLAARAGYITVEEMFKINEVQGISHRQGMQINRERRTTRQGAKKAAPTSITFEQADALKQQPRTPQGYRDALLVCIMVDHGLRCSEIADLMVEGFDITDGTFRFYRRKVDKTEMHAMTDDTLRAYLAYMGHGGPTAGRLWFSSDRHGHLTNGTMKVRAINKRIGVLGRAIGIPNLSPHDLRHIWATRAVKGGTNIIDLQHAGGWNSIAMPARYAERHKIANQGIRLKGKEQQ